MDDTVYIIVLNWNGTGDTISCLNTLRENDYSNFTIVLVDNGSDLEPLSILKKWCINNFEHILFYTEKEAINGGTKKEELSIKLVNSENKLIFIEINDNIGFAAGNNVALKYVLKNNATYVMLLNNDTYVLRDSLSLLMKFMKENDDYVAVVPQIRYSEKKNKIWNCGGKITWFGNRKYYYANYLSEKVPKVGYKQITYVTGCALLFKPHITGILTEKFFFGEEDLDFSFRQKKNHRKMACVFSSIIYHKVSSSVNKIMKQKIGRVYLFYLSRFIDNRQYSSNVYYLIKVTVNLVYAIPMILFRYRFGLKQTYFMLSTLIKELNKIDKITKKYCFKSLEEDFNRPIKWES